MDKNNVNYLGNHFKVIYRQTKRQRRGFNILLIRRRHPAQKPNEPLRLESHHGRHLILKQLHGYERSQKNQSHYSQCQTPLRRRHLQTLLIIVITQLPATCHHVLLIFYQRRFRNKTPKWN